VIYTQPQAMFRCQSTEHEGRERCRTTPDALRASDQGCGKDGIFTNLGDSWPLLELFIEVFVGLTSVSLNPTIPTSVQQRNRDKRKRGRTRNGEQGRIMNPFPVPPWS